ncbi:uncharacterized protein [Apostichopus japonicus]|uniref:uncharacterized protein isoform X2 n=1 Tax=Stichopus japonicus TaxID=307972 RepID=UPI003AB43E47
MTLTQHSTPMLRTSMDVFMILPFLIGFALAVPYRTMESAESFLNASTPCNFSIYGIFSDGASMSFAPNPPIRAYNISFPTIKANLTKTDGTWSKQFDGVLCDLKNLCPIIEGEKRSYMFPVLTLTPYLEKGIYRAWVSLYDDDYNLAFGFYIHDCPF